ncbi:fatty acid elongase Elo1 [Schizosaccharomyces osmophilus]|uniref:Elongation of fatty acids protein n=1 Tax=Schizosaccharomyces osmophilus TaxID=2545709 RepID=A0AAE9WCL7_9SCHI|nr:fatty acid elongase Elo1 [Schizosaccharomyces osmophilus]WBW73378.1 fatty acid elongase Elo1 [Schizosaccharomyces osmophilus]
MPSSRALSHNQMFAVENDSLASTKSSYSMPFVLFSQFQYPLWNWLNAFSEAIFGKSTSSFSFVVGKTHFSSFPTVAFLITGYYVSIFAGSRLMKNRSPIRLKKTFQYYNLVFSVTSSILALLIFEQVAPMIYQHGFFFSICNEKAWSQPLLFLYYCAYISKFLELADTFFLVLRKKPLQFLHYYHHGATALLVYSQIVGRTSISWLIIEINLLVHVVMYYYYYLVARGIRVPWKKWVTRFQIIQFFTDLGFIYFVFGTELLYRSKNYNKYCWGHCSGEPFAAFCGLITISSYLILFVVFYRNTYKKNAAAKKSKQSAPSNVSDNLHLKLFSKNNASLTESSCNTLVSNLGPISSGIRKDN